VLGVAASLAVTGYDPREEFKAMFLDASALYMEAARDKCQRALQDFEAAEVAAKQEARKSGLIKVSDYACGWEDRRVGEECKGVCRSRWSRRH
jgi:hypothetical protein